MRPGAPVVLDPVALREGADDFLIKQENEKKAKTAAPVKKEPVKEPVKAAEKKQEKKESTEDIANKQLEPKKAVKKPEPEKIEPAATNKRGSTQNFNND